MFTEPPRAEDWQYAHQAALTDPEQISDYFAHHLSMVDFFDRSKVVEAEIFNKLESMNPSQWMVYMLTGSNDELILKCLKLIKQDYLKDDAFVSKYLPQQQP